MGASLEGRTAVVTGSSSGIGRAIAVRLGAEGAFVALSGRDEAALKEAAARIEASGGRTHVAVGDVREEGHVTGLVDAAVAATGRLDVMVNNAGISYLGPVLEGDAARWQEMFDVNVVALLVGCQAAVRAMRACKAQGHIVNVSSIAAQRADSGVYGATKHAVTCISHTLRRELEEDSIRVVDIRPGAIATNFARNFDPAFVANFVRATGMDIEVRRGERLPDEVMEKLQPMMRQVLASAEQVADAVLYAVTQPIDVNVAEIVVRPAKQLAL